MRYRITLSHVIDSPNDSEAKKKAKKYIRKMDQFEDNSPKLEKLVRTEHAKADKIIYSKED